MFADLIPDIDLAALAPFGVAALFAVVALVVVVGAVKGKMAGDGHYGIIEAYVGFVRHGKTMLAVQDCIALARAQGAILVSNIAIYADGIQTELIPITDDGLDLDRLMVLALDCRERGVGLVLLIDEAGIVMPARQWQTFPVGLMWLLQQSGKLRISIRYTVQHPVFADSILRGLTAVVHNVRATPPPTILRRMKGKRPWFFEVTTTIPGDFGTEKPDRIMWRRRVRYRRRWEGSYDTDAAILPAGRLKGAAEFLARLEAAKAGATAPALDVDPRLRAAIDQLPHGKRESVIDQIRTARPFSVDDDAA